MGSSIEIDKEIKIRNVNKTWKKITEAESPVSLNLTGVETVDGSGLQLIVYLISIAEKFPEKYCIEGISDNLKELLESFCIDTKEREVEK